MALTDRQVKAAETRPTPYKLADGAGLHLLVTPAGGRLWRYRYEFGGKEKLLAVGRYPGMSLAQARTARQEARALLDDGRDPATAKRVRIATRANEAATTFKPVAEAWFEVQKGRWSDAHARDVRRNLENDVYPVIGHLPLRDITPRIVLHMVREIEARSLHTARKTRQQVSAVFVYAIAEDLAATDPAAIIHRAMKPLAETVHFPALRTVEELRDLLRQVDAVPAYPVTRLALRLLALTVPRPNELRGARPEEFEGLDGPEPVWRIPKERMKGRKGKRREHVVPLAPAAVDVVRVAMAQGWGPMLFPNLWHAHRPMSVSAMNGLIDRAGYEGRHTPHGFRASFSTIMNEAHPQERAVIDLMLAHLPPNETEAAYNRAAYMVQRRALAAEWATLLMEGMPPAADLLLLPRVREGQGPHQPGRRPLPKKPYGPRRKNVEHPENIG